MQRWTPVLAGLVVAAGLVVLVARAGRRDAPTPAAGPSASASASAAPQTAAPASSEEPAAFDPTAPSTDPEPAGDGGTLPSSAPGSVGFGVILIAYQGAQFAPANARAKAEAQQLATSLIDPAKKDFAEAVKKGDRGSTADAGRIPRGVLEPAIEQALFTLEKGAVHPEPLDTPRGYWIIRRTD